MAIDRIHIFGASGSGTTTLGSMLAEALSCPHFDTDDYFWIPTDPPYTTKRAPADRLELLRTDLLQHSSWVLSGSLCGWGDPLIGMFDLAVFLYVPTEIRVERILAREIKRYGSEALKRGGRMHEIHLAFMDYVRSYDTGDLSIRSIARHEDWITRLPCRLLRMEEDLPNGDRLARVMEAVRAG